MKLSQKRWVLDRTLLKPVTSPLPHIFFSFKSWGTSIFQVFPSSKDLCFKVQDDCKLLECRHYTSCFSEFPIELYSVNLDCHSIHMDWMGSRIQIKYTRQGIPKIGMETLTPSVTTGYDGPKICIAVSYRKWHACFHTRHEIPSTHQHPPTASYFRQCSTFSL